MKPKKRQKLCHNCEAGVDLDVIVCPFCAADLRAEKGEMRSAYASLETPLYPSTSASAPREQPEEMRSSVEEAVNKEWVPITLCTLGAQLFLLGLLMLFCSHKGALVVKWNSDYWFLYCLFSGPLFYLGYRALKKI